MTYKPGGDTVTKDGRTSQFVALGFTNTFSIHLDTGSLVGRVSFLLFLFLLGEMTRILWVLCHNLFLP